MTLTEKLRRRRVASAVLDFATAYYDRSDVQEMLEGAVGLTKLEKQKARAASAEAKRSFQQKYNSELEADLGPGVTTNTYGDQWKGSASSDPRGHQEAIRQFRVASAALRD
jgi:hypothetical protein